MHRLFKAMASEKIDVPRPPTPRWNRSAKTLLHKALLQGCAVANKLWPGSALLAGLAARTALLLGDEHQAEMYGRRALQSLSASPRRLRRLSNMASRLSSKKARPDEIALTRSLADVQECLEAVGLTPFLVFGTLLGCIREQRFIPGDTDIDLGVLGVSQIESARDALSRSGRLKIIRCFYSNGVLTKVRSRHRNGCHIDLIAFSNDGPGVSWSSFNRKIILSRHYPGSIRPRRCTFQGLTVYVPEEAEDFLSWHYGDWRHPDAGYHWITSGPIRSQDQRAWARIGAPYAVLSSIIHNGLKKSLLMAQNAGDLFPEDELWRDIARALERAMADQAQPR